MPDEVQNLIPLVEALKAQSALRDAANLPPESFPVPAFIGMVSDEIEALRNRGLSDEQIAQVIRNSSTIALRAEDIATFYASPEQRHGHDL